MTTRPQALIILDGFGYRAEHNYNAIAQANLPFFNYLLKNYPFTFLEASETAVGLLPGMMGNSAVGHFTIGVGEIIQQPITIITHTIENGSFFENDLLKKTFKTAHYHNQTVHCLGLLSDAGVHSHEKHLYALLHMARQEGVADLVVHPILDGRDVPPFSASVYLERLEKVLQEIGSGIIGSLHGRFYAMDRDDNWERTLVSHQALLTQSPKNVLWKNVLEEYYQQNISEEFLPPCSINAHSYLKNNDVLIFFNIRADRARQLTALLLNYPHLDHLRFIPLQTPIKVSYQKTPSLSVITGIKYYDKFQCPVLYQQPYIKNTLLKFFNEHKKTIFTIAESEKYAHVTYFFNGGREVAYPYETRIVVPSLKDKEYSTHPCMAAPTITQKLIESWNKNMHDFYLINYANADMVGHSGDLLATIQAIECLDQQLQQIYEVFVKKYHGILYITGDHGNAEEKYDSLHHTKRTSHTTNPVYFIYINDADYQKKVQLKTLADISPFIKSKTLSS